MVTLRAAAAAAALGLYAWRRRSKMPEQCRSYADAGLQTRVGASELGGGVHARGTRIYVTIKIRRILMTSR